ncbi:succinoglycan biosynthesis protein ExoM [Mesorhizobium sp. J18]|uniref:glycosyltransferase n=1 Tax=Mesorhizobium sp. J18 TaxID=935263 RepID=UPI00119B511C|nr:glycosyltransferase family 2 protein [Mesorhizobium sp. J18]TWG93034.1 succinoglycan biosynthesis protein ExoM [Mesorhizobium sp. J18]
MSNIHNVDICVCTFRRREIEDTLRSVAALRLPEDVAIRVIVVDNDVMPSARGRVEQITRDFPHPITYVHAPARNISIARNACLENCTGDYAAFVDDDEIVSPDWLKELLAVAEREGADVVLGPVHAVYGEDAPAWMRKADIHSTFPVWVRGVIRTGYTCNVLLDRRSPRLSRRRFDLAFGRSGGEDTDFFTRLFQAGGRIAYAPDAKVHELVPRQRASFAWLAKRRFRMGQTHGRLLAEKARGARQFREIALAGAKASYCFGFAMIAGLLPAHRNASVLRGIMHAGVIVGLMGVREISQYGVAAGGERGNEA